MLNRALGPESGSDSATRVRTFPELLSMRSYVLFSESDLTDHSSGTIVLSFTAIKRKANCPSGEGASILSLVSSSASCPQIGQTQITTIDKTTTVLCKLAILVRSNKSRCENKPNYPAAAIT